MPRESLKRSLARVLTVFVALCRTRFGLTLRELEEEVPCSRRTLYRYLNIIEDCGIHIVVSTRPNGILARQILEINGRRIRVTA